MLGMYDKQIEIDPKVARLEDNIRGVVKNLTEFRLDEFKEKVNKIDNYRGCGVAGDIYYNESGELDFSLFWRVELGCSTTQIKKKDMDGLKQFIGMPVRYISLEDEEVVNGHR